ncbi:hypothetical protein DPMN_170274 [Dreissena polymorpha]|uniref:Uncharacterized protein n=1 Tax=Dreissena polymorpha TaxID=45954 RepID=A0A9D4IE43_DREPO|nr:hypothetical protein DPMN_170274 [Dreissena polymorpha]
MCRTKDESKLKQWRLDWDVYDPLQDTIESCPPPGADKPEIKTEPVDIDLKGDNCATSVLPDISMGNCSGGVVIKQECQTGSDMTSADLVSPRNVNLSESSSDNIATNHNTNNCPVDGNNSSNNLSENVESNALLSREICRSNGQEAQTSVSSNLGDQHGEQLTNNEQHRQVWSELYGYVLNVKIILVHIKGTKCCSLIPKFTIKHYFALLSTHGSWGALGIP